MPFVAKRFKIDNINCLQTLIEYSENYYYKDRNLRGTTTKIGPQRAILKQFWAKTEYPFA